MNAELIKALRYCAEHEGCDYYIAKDCPREDTWVCGVDCEQILMLAAADAIEALQAKCDRLEQKCKAQQERNEEYCEKQTYIDKWGAKWMTSAKDVPSAAYQHGFCDGQAYEQQTTIEAQIPKRGEWIAVKDWLQIPQEDSGTYRCSACGQVMKYPWNYCPNCGAKMKGGRNDNQRM
jgi:hypothetical protein